MSISFFFLLASSFFGASRLRALRWWLSFKALSLYASQLSEKRVACGADAEQMQVWGFEGSCTLACANPASSGWPSSWWYSLLLCSSQHKKFALEVVSCCQLGKTMTQFKQLFNFCYKRKENLIWRFVVGATISLKSHCDSLNCLMF